MVEMTAAQYQAFVKARCPRSPIGKDMLCAFLMGGFICALGQLLQNLWLKLGVLEADAGTLTGVTLVFLGTVLTGLGVYDRLAKFGGAGTLIPITGFANAVASPALEFKAEGLIPGMAAKMFLVAGPVIVFGISASALYGLILFLLQ